MNGRSSRAIAHRREAEIDGLPEAGALRRRKRSPALSVRRSCPSRPTLAVPMQPAMVDAAGLRPDPQRDLARGSEPFADRIVTTVAGRDRLDQSRRLGSTAAASSRARPSPITFRQERIPSTFTWDFSPKGQHVELGIAEMNLFIMLSALGLVALHPTASGCCPIGTLYDPFIQPWPRCAELRLLSGCAVHVGGDAVRA